MSDLLASLVEEIENMRREATYHRLAPPPLVVGAAESEEDVTGGVSSTLDMNEPSYSAVSYLGAADSFNGPPVPGERTLTTDALNSLSSDLCHDFLDVQGDIFDDSPLSYYEDDELQDAFDDTELVRVLPCLGVDVRLSSCSPRHLLRPATWRSACPEQLAVLGTRITTTWTSTTAALPTTSDRTRNLGSAIRPRNRAQVCPRFDARRVLSRGTEQALS
jgi:hypothetical protein